jgi:hypothetical protein
MIETVGSKQKHLQFILLYPKKWHNFAFYKPNSLLEVITAKLTLVSWYKLFENFHPRTFVIPNHLSVSYIT